MLPIRTFPASLMLAGLLRAGGNAGLAVPIRTLPLSEMTVGGTSRTSTVPFMGSSICSAEPYCSDLHVVRESLPTIKGNRVFVRELRLTSGVAMSSTSSTPGCWALTAAAYPAQRPRPSTLARRRSVAEVLLIASLGPPCDAMRHVPT